jgi:hypothetical protein
VNAGYEELKNCVHLIDGCFQEFKLPCYYQVETLNSMVYYRNNNLPTSVLI